MVQLPLNTTFYSDALHCPTCNESYLHHDWIEIYSRSEDDEVTMVTMIARDQTLVRAVPSKETNNPSVRRDGMLIGFYCEHCPVDEHFYLGVSQHKGCTFVEWVTPKYPNQYDQIWSDPYPWKDTA